MKAPIASGKEERITKKSITIYTRYHENLNAQINAHEQFKKKKKKNLQNNRMDENSTI